MRAFLVKNLRNIIVFIGNQNKCDGPDHGKDQRDYLNVKLELDS